MRVFRSVPRRPRVVFILFIPAAGLIVASPAAARADVTATAVAPVITSAGFVQVELREPVDYTVTTTGTPTPALAELGQLPAGITFTDNGNGTVTSDGPDHQDGGLVAFALSVTMQGAPGQPNCWPGPVSGGMSAGSRSWRWSARWPATSPSARSGRSHPGCPRYVHSRPHRARSPAAG